MRVRGPTIATFLAEAEESLALLGSQLKKSHSDVRLGSSLGSSGERLRRRQLSTPPAQPTEGASSARVALEDSSPRRGAHEPAGSSSGFKPEPGGLNKTVNQLLEREEDVKEQLAVQAKTLLRVDRRLQALEGRVLHPEASPRSGAGAAAGGAAGGGLGVVFTLPPSCGAPQPPAGSPKDVKDFCEQRFARLQTETRRHIEDLGKSLRQWLDETESGLQVVWEEHLSRDAKEVAAAPEPAVEPLAAKATADAAPEKPQGAEPASPPPPPAARPDVAAGAAPEDDGGHLPGQLLDGASADGPATPAGEAHPSELQEMATRVAQQLLAAGPQVEDPVPADGVPRQVEAHQAQETREHVASVLADAVTAGTLEERLEQVFGGGEATEAAEGAPCEPAAAAEVGEVSLPQTPQNQARSVEHEEPKAKIRTAAVQVGVQDPNALKPPSPGRCSPVMPTARRRNFQPLFNFAPVDRDLGGSGAGASSGLFACNRLAQFSDVCMVQSPVSSSSRAAPGAEAAAAAKPSDAEEPPWTARGDRPAHAADAAPGAAPFELPSAVEGLTIMSEREPFADLTAEILGQQREDGSVASSSPAADEDHQQQQDTAEGAVGEAASSAAAAPAEAAASESDATETDGSDSGESSHAEDGPAAPPQSSSAAAEQEDVELAGTAGAASAEAGTSREEDHVEPVPSAAPVGAVATFGRPRSLSPGGAVAQVVEAFEQRIASKERELSGGRSPGGLSPACRSPAGRSPLAPGNRSPLSRSPKGFFYRETLASPTREAQGQEHAQAKEEQAGSEAAVASPAREAQERVEAEAKEDEGSSDAGESSESEEEAVGSGGASVDVLLGARVAEQAIAGDEFATAVAAAHSPGRPEGEDVVEGGPAVAPGTAHLHPPDADPPASEREMEVHEAATAGDAVSGGPLADADLESCTSEVGAHEPEDVTIGERLSDGPRPVEEAGLVDVGQEAAPPPAGGHPGGDPPGPLEPPPPVVGKAGATVPLDEYLLSDQDLNSDSSEEAEPAAGQAGFPEAAVVEPLAEQHEPDRPSVDLWDQLLEAIPPPPSTLASPVFEETSEGPVGFQQDRGQPSAPAVAPADQASAVAPVPAPASDGSSSCDSSDDEGQVKEGAVREVQVAGVAAAGVAADPGGQPVAPSGAAAITGLEDVSSEDDLGAPDAAAPTRAPEPSAAGGQGTPQGEQPAPAAVAVQDATQRLEVEDLSSDDDLDLPEVAAAPAPVPLHPAAGAQPAPPPPATAASASQGLEVEDLSSDDDLQLPEVASAPAPAPPPHPAAGHQQPASTAAAAQLEVEDMSSDDDEGIRPAQAAAHAAPSAAAGSPLPSAGAAQRSSTLTVEDSDEDGSSSDGSPQAERRPQPAIAEQLSPFSGPPATTSQSASSASSPRGNREAQVSTRTLGEGGTTTGGANDDSSEDSDEGDSSDGDREAPFAPKPTMRSNATGDTSGDSSSAASPRAGAHNHQHQERGGGSMPATADAFAAAVASSLERPNMRASDHTDEVERVSSIRSTE